MNVAVSLRILAVIAATLTLANASETKPWDRAYTHDQTGVIFPKTIGDLHVIERTAFGKGGFGGDNVGVRYEKGATTVDIYLYKLPDEPPEADGDPAHKRELIQAKDAFDAIETVSKRTEGSRYTDLVLPDKLTVTEFGGGLHIVGGSVSYTQVSGEKAQPLKSAIWVTELDGYFIKSRYSFVRPKGGDANAKLEKQPDQFLSKLKQLIAETPIRELVREGINTLAHNPADKTAAGLVVSYADVSNLVTISISADDLPFLSADEFKGTELLLASFVAGCLQHQFENLEFKGGTEQGREAMLNAYRKLRKSDACSAHPDFDKALERTGR